MKLPVPEIDYEAIGGKAFVLAVGCGAVSSVMKWFEHLDNGSYTAIIIATVGAFVATNSIDRHTDAKADADVKKARIAADTVPGTLGSS